MKANYFFASLVCLFGAVAFAADDVVIQLKTGETEVVRYRRESLRVKRSKGKLERVTAKGEVAVEVLKPVEGQTRVAWVQGEFAFEDPKINESPAVKTIANLVSGIQVVLELNETGALERVVNLDELAKVKDKHIAALSQLLKESDTNPAHAKKAIDTVSQLYSTPEKVAEIFGKEPGTFSRSGRRRGQAGLTRNVGRAGQETRQTSPCRPTIENLSNVRSQRICARPRNRLARATDSNTQSGGRRLRADRHADDGAG